MIRNLIKTYILWGLFALTIIIPLLDIILNSYGLYFLTLTILKFTLPLLLLLWHARLIFGVPRSLLLLLPPFIIGFIFEVLGVNLGVIFGGAYSYNPSSLGPIILGVPILIPFFWSFFVYTAYLITFSTLAWLNINNPKKSNKNFLLLLPLIIVDSLIVVIIDLFMDPVMVGSGNWTWASGGFYFGIPFGNFAGWFLVAFISLAIFRIYEYFFPPLTPNYSQSLLLIPVVGYGLLCLIFTILALNLGLTKVAGIGASLMLPISLINLLLYLKSNQRLKLK